MTIQLASLLSQIFLPSLQSIDDWSAPISTALHMTEHRFELAVLFSAGAGLMLCSLLLRRFLPGVRRQPGPQAAAAPPPVKFPVAEAAE